MKDTKNNKEKLRLIKEAVKKSKLLDENGKIAELLISDICSKSSVIFEITDDENEIYKLVEGMIKNSLNKIKEDGLIMADNIKDIEKDPINTVQDPKTIVYDITGEGEYLKKLLKKLAQLDEIKPEKHYISIFYERYIKKLPSNEIAVRFRISENELENRLFDIIKFVNKEE